MTQTLRSLFHPRTLALQRSALSRSHISPVNLKVLVSKSDFGMDIHKFPSGMLCWSKLKSKYGKTHTIKVLDDGMGHSMMFWKKAFSIAFNQD